MCWILELLAHLPYYLSMRQLAVSAPKGLQQVVVAQCLTTFRASWPFSRGWPHGLSYGSHLLPSHEAFCVVKFRRYHKSVEWHKQAYQVCIARRIQETNLINKRLSLELSQKALCPWCLCFSSCRHVKLNATPTSLAFYDDRGSLLVGIGKNLFRIDAHHCEHRETCT